MRSSIVRFLLLFIVAIFHCSPVATQAAPSTNPYQAGVNELIDGLNEIKILPMRDAVVALQMTQQAAMVLSTQYKQHTLAIQLLEQALTIAKSIKQDPTIPLSTIRRSFYGKQLRIYFQLGFVNDSKLAEMETWLGDPELDLSPNDPFTIQLHEFLSTQHLLRAKATNTRKHANIALAQWKKQTPENHYLRINPHIRIAQSYRLEGDGKKAIAVARKAKKIASVAYDEGNDHLLNASLLLAELEWEYGEKKNACTEFKQIASSATNAHGRFVYHVGKALLGQGRCELAAGKMEKGSKLLKQGRDIIEYVFPEDHPARINAITATTLIPSSPKEEKDVHSSPLLTDYKSCAAQAQALALSENYPAAFNAMLQADEQLRQFAPIALASPYVTAQQDYIDALNTSFAELVRFSKEHKETLQGTTSKLYAQWLNRKALFFDAQYYVQSSLRTITDPQQAAQLQRLNTIRRRLSSLIFSPIHSTCSTEYYKELLNKRKTIQTKLNAAVKRSASLTTAIAAKDLPLAKDSALIDIMKLEETRTTQGGYYAFVVLNNKVNLVSLGTVSEIEKVIAAYRKAITTNAERKTIFELGARAYNRLFAPLVALLGNTTRLIISPDGLLNLLPFETLWNPKGHFVISDYTIQYVLTPRDLLRSNSPAASNDVIVFAAPHFSSKRSTNASVENTTRLEFQPLPATQKEAELLQQKYKTTAHVFTGKKATENEFLSLKTAPKILHVATHGFFINNAEEKSATANSRALKTIQPSGVTIQAASQNTSALLRSGLAFSEVGTTANDTYFDGIATAEEILSLNLSGTKLVVLSACETGLGTLEEADGMWGLRRAFHLAGAEQVIATSWSVQDKAALAVIEKFYDKFQKDDAVEALNSAKRNYMKQLKEQRGFAHPQLWGGFFIQ